MSAPLDFIKLGATATVAAPVLKVFESYIALPVMGVPISVSMAALFGAGLSLFFGDPIESRRSLWGQLAAATVFGVATATFLADALQLEWAIKNPPMFALLMAAMLRWFLPSIIERGKLFIQNFSFSFSKSKKDGE